MFDFFGKTVAKLFGTKSDKDIKEVLPYVSKVNEEYAKLTNLTDDQLRHKTVEIRGIINERLKSIDDKIAALHKRVADEPELNIVQKEAIFSEIDELEKQRNKDLEVVLMEVLPVGFAVVKETARRWKENGQLVVTANDMDRALAARKPNVQLDGDKAIWANKWEAAGNEITWEMLHYDVQLIGGIVLHQGKIAEMATGEGKTLVATLPAYLNALSGRGVHVVTVNDYLARRDSEWMAPLFEFHGITIDCIDKHQPNSEARRNAYKADITYGTNNEFGFDYLRDNMSREPQDLVQRKHHYAMVDEVDSVLIDDARTPLIISGPVPRGDEHEFHILKPRISMLVEAQRKVVNNFLTEAKRLIKEGNDKEGGLALFRAYRGLPKSKPLIKFLSETGNRAIMQKVENHYLQDNSRMMPEADEPLYFTIDEKHNQIELTEQGVDLITGQGEDPNFFIMPDIGTEIANLENDKSLSHEELLQAKEHLIADFQEKSKRIHTINQLLKAYTLFEKDTEYIVTPDNKVKIVDEQTGRVMEGRRYSDGLHQAIEAKENVKVEDATQTYATVTLQNYFRMYHKLSGMTGTAETEAGEFWDIYKLDVVVIPTNRVISRKDEHDKVYKTVREKYNAVADEIVALTEAGRPVLVGTTSVEISELLSRMLTLRKIKHQVLNAKMHQKEAEIVAEAGKPSTVTIATNMAGRGTDIKLAPESKAAGGLAIIGTERHESRRVDRQLRGRAGRQGDPGSSQFFVSLEDNLMRLFGSDRIARLMDRMGLEEGEVIQHSMITNSIERAQKKVEENNFGQRKRLLEYDDVMNAQREVVYKRRRNALYGERLELDIWNMIYDISEDVIVSYKNISDYENFQLHVLRVFGIESAITENEFKSGQANLLVERLYNEALNHYLARNKQVADHAYPIISDIHANRGPMIENVAVPFTDGKRQLAAVANLTKTYESHGMELLRAMEKLITLGTIDQAWTDHLRQMDDLKQSVQNAVYEQKDPLLIYKFESFELFKRMIGKVNEETIAFLFHAFIPVQAPEQVQQPVRPPMAPKPPVLKEQKQEVHSSLENQSGHTSMPAPEPEKIMPVHSQKVAGRNDRVSVQYTDGRVVKDVKYKTVEDDLLHNRCIIIED
ncbi:preprotein translocase subunit SecA [Pontibacter sp. BT310]|uniref:Protein translocase subunit SecA n=1 Tax=Pontibacter populi TaxID=890055 RepID=A0ABS6X7R8_9BACT|nr:MULTISPECIES: preprotein translocase subunit SecA [Pontibacter]MBJ6117186.1 preprotein translocase subunit SecA [Pontibacter sp. BT310]MBR0569611.1 preprotein translocase subunit SecA [Microvirga sp. STS03]MBW3364039.1 preprotein translocase subunit SecA [Pontibacter populi]